MNRFKNGRTLVILAGSAALLAAAGPSSQPQVAPGAPAADESRHFRFDYTTTINDISNDTSRVRVWIPLPQSDENQTIERLSVETTPPIDHRLTTEAVYGNSLAFFEVDQSQMAIPGVIEIVVSFDVLRHETGDLSRLNRAMSAEELLGSDQLAPLTDEVKRRAGEATATNTDTDTMARARNLYDRVLADVDYDKSGAGWGRGDIHHACDIGKGNCTDFHTLFIGMSRAVEIPAFFEIGFLLPPERGEGAVGGYHCWAWFQDAESGTWKPVDASEADKAPATTEYFFGTLCCNRVALTRGRDLVLDPAPAQGPVNFFIYPIVEIDGVDAGAKVTRTFGYRDLE